MKYTKSLLPIFCIVVAFSYPTKKDFSEAFIKVAEEGNPAVVSIVSEKVIESSYHQFFDPFGGQVPRDEFKGHSLGSGVIIDQEIHKTTPRNYEERRWKRAVFKGPDGELIEIRGR